MLNTIGFRETEKALQLGLLFKAQEALDIKLIDEIAEPTEVLAQAQVQMQKWLRIPGKAYHFHSKGLK